MKHNTPTCKILLTFIIILNVLLCWGQSPDSEALSSLQLRDSRFIPVKQRAIEIYDVTTPRIEIGKRLFREREHPAFDEKMSARLEQKLLAEINDRCDQLGKDTLLTSDLLWVYRPYLEWLFNEDPHYRMDGKIPVKDVKMIRQLKIPAFDVLCVNDTIIVNQTLDPLFRRGDMIMFINDIPMTEYMKYTYKDRYDSPANIMRYYYFSNVVNQFNIQLKRGKETLSIITEGKAQKSVSVELTQKTELMIQNYPTAHSGYISIPRFYSDNSRLIKILYKTILSFKRQGLTNVILDLRQNPGGNGDRFDELISIFTDKPAIQYLKSAKVKCSRRAMSVYSFITDDMLGNIVDLPSHEVAKEVVTIPKMFVPGMNYYVLMSKNTGSIAASFCNILQYNGIAKLVGEPLHRNATKYGETIPGRILLPTLLQPSSISIVEFDEYTKAVDGVLMPDIAIPYVAQDYLTGRDAMLDKLLEIIESDQDN